MFKSDQSLDFHNKLIESVALGERCPNKSRSSAYILTSPLGHIYTNACPDGLHCVRLYGDTDYDSIDWNIKVDYIRASSLLGTNKHVNMLKRYLQTYMDNPLKCVEKEMPQFCCLEKYGDFNSRIWLALRDTCPPGELISYSELALRAGQPAGSAKVVGWAINKNPYSLIVGDHRVVKANGEIMVCDNSQRNKLRRLLVEHEISFTRIKNVDLALLAVRKRCSANPVSRARKSKASADSPGTSSGRSGRGRKRTSRVGRAKSRRRRRSSSRSSSRSSAVSRASSSGASSRASSRRSLSSRKAAAAVAPLSSLSNIADSDDDFRNSVSIKHEQDDPNYEPDRNQDDEDRKIEVVTLIDAQNDNEQVQHKGRRLSSPNVIQTPVRKPKATRSKSQVQSRIKQEIVEDNGEGYVEASRRSLRSRRRK